MNRTLSYGAKLFAHLDPSKGVDAYRQQDGGHGSRNPLRSVDSRMARTEYPTYTRTQQRSARTDALVVCRIARWSEVHTS